MKTMIHPNSTKRTISVAPMMEEVDKVELLLLTVS